MPQEARCHGGGNVMIAHIRAHTHVRTRARGMLCTLSVGTASVGISALAEVL